MIPYADFEFDHGRRQTVKKAETPADSVEVAVSSLQRSRHSNGI